jgi:ABC-type phosphate transport system substrate-binding protein
MRMKRFTRAWIGCIIAALAAFLSALAPAQSAPSDDVAVIVNATNPLDGISSAELRKLFAGEKRSWHSSMPVVLVVRAPEARERTLLLSRVLKMTESDYKQYWVKKIYSGEVPREPTTLFSNAMQLEAVRAERGGIALISLSDVRSGVKVLKIDGILPGAAGYPLK